MTYRIASLLAAGTEILYGLGLGDSVVAISHECDYPADALDKPRVTSALLDANQSSNRIDHQVRTHIESGLPLYRIDALLLAELRPEVIVTQAQCEVCAISERDVRFLVNESEWGRNCRVLALNPTTLDEVFHDIQRVADFTGVSDRGLVYIRSLRDRLNAVRSRTDLLAPDQRPRVACLEWIDPLMVAANWVPDLLEIAGGKGGLTKSGQHSTYASWTDLLAYDPEVIVVAPCGFDLDRTLDEKEVLTRREGWRDLSATRNRRVYAVDGNALFNRSGPRLIDTVELLAHLLHPDLFDERSTHRAWCQL